MAKLEHPQKTEQYDHLIEGLRDPEYGIIKMPYIAETVQALEDLQSERDSLKEQVKRLEKSNG